MGKGDFLLHLGPEDHERLRKAAGAEGMSMAQYLKEGLEMRIAAGRPSAMPLSEALRLVADVAGKLADEAAHGPAEPSPLRSAPTSWDGILNGEGSG
jgi:hypothetical protein